MSSNLENSLLTALHKFVMSNRCHTEDVVIYISIKRYWDLRYEASPKNMTYDPAALSQKFVGATLIIFKDENVDVDFYFAMADAKKEIERLRLENQQLRSVIIDVNHLIDNSLGVCGLHMNGDVAPWESLLRGGCCEEWLGNFSDVSERFLK